MIHNAELNFTESKRNAGGNAEKLCEREKS